MQLHAHFFGLRIVLISRGYLVVKVTDSWLVCHEFKPSTAEDPPCRGGRCTLNVSRVRRPPVGVVKFEEGVGYLRCRPHHLTMVQNDEIRRRENSRVTD
ncbi:hypothetical protein TNCV_3176541 [Trichonephila clavipes]|nr:hypothetical protein TNCV_3176541 [Trichonephila clavipes]